MGQRGDQLRPGRVPAEVAAGTAGDGGGDAARVVRGAEDDDVRLGVGRDEPPGGFDTCRDRALRPDQHDVDGLTGVPGQQLVTVRYAVDATDPRDRGHHSGEPFTDTASVVADQDRRHGVSFLQPGDIPLPLSDALARTLTRSGGFF